MQFKKIMLLLLVTSVLAFGVFAQGNKQALIKGKAQVAFLEIDGQVHEITVGKLSEIKIAGKLHNVKVRLAEHTTFQDAGFSFKYSANNNFSLDESTPGLKMWSIDGDSTVLMIQEYVEKVELADLVAAMKAQFIQMKANVKVENVAIKGENGLLKGKRLRINLGEILLTQEIFLVKKGVRSTYIIFQDSLQDNGTHSHEYAKMMKLFKQSFAIKKTK